LQLFTFHLYIHMDTNTHINKTGFFEPIDELGENVLYSHLIHEQGLFTYLSSTFCNFHHIVLVHVLLSICLGVLFSFGQL
jgi:hypothetical protein